jgi:hypothetical protein
MKFTLLSFVFYSRETVLIDVIVRSQKVAENPDEVIFSGWAESQTIVLVVS